MPFVNKLHMALETRVGYKGWQGVVSKASETVRIGCYCPGCTTYD